MSPLIIPIIGLLLLFSGGLFLPGISSGGVVDANIGLIDLNDGETSYAGFAGKALTVNAGETGWTFTDVNGSTYNCISTPDGNTFTCTVTFQQNIIVGPDKNIGSSSARANTIFSNTFNCAGLTGDCLIVNPNQKIFSIPSSAYQVFKSPARYVSFGSTAAGIEKDTFFVYISGGGDASLDMIARTTDPTGTQQPGGQLYKKLFTHPDGATGDQNDWFIRDQPFSSFHQLGAIQYFDTTTWGNANMLSNLIVSLDINGLQDLHITGFTDLQGDVDVVGDTNMHGTLTVDQNIFGQLIVAGNLIGVTCNTTCGSVGYAGPWTCVEADNVTGAASTCADITVAHNCLCRN